MKLSPHFSLSELIRSPTATRLGIQNTPDISAVANLRQLCQKIMEPVRVRLNNHPVFITSGYRSPELNKLIGGSKSSAHMKGLAADFIAPSFGTPEEIAFLLAASDIEFDQLIYEGSWIHISYSDTPRRQLLTAHFSGGRATYAPGIVAS